MQTQTQEQQQLHPSQLKNYHCLICKQIAQQPVVTICGHLFCWQCVHSQKTCPYCQRSFQTNEFIPIYTSSSPTSTESQRKSSLLSTMKIPPKPKAINNQKIKNSNVISAQTQLPNSVTLNDNISRQTIITGNAFFPPTVIHSFMTSDQLMEQCDTIGEKSKKKQIQQLLIIITLLIIACLMAII